MKKLILPSYFLKEFLYIFFLLLIGLTLIFTFIDLQSGFSKSELSHMEIFLFLTNSLLEKSIFIFPCSFFFASVYTSYNMSRNNEFLAFKAGGVNFLSAYKKIFLFCFFIIIFLIINNFLILPKINKLMLLQKSPKTLDNQVLFFTYEEKDVQRLWYLKKLKNHFIVSLVEKQNGNITYDLYSNKAYHKDNEWKFENAKIIHYKNNSPAKIERKPIVKKNFNENIKEILNQKNFPNNSLFQDTKKGFSSHQRLIETYRKLLSPLLCLGALIIGTAFSITNTRTSFSFITPFFFMVIFVLISRLTLIIIKKFDSGLIMLPLLFPIILFTIIGGYQIVKKT